MDKNYKQFVDKLNSYIRKFYFYQLIRGFILFALLVLVYFSFITGLEFFNYFDPKIKFTIALITVALTLLIVFYFILIPLIKLFGRGKRLTYYDVSSLLSKTYPEIKDKLINIVELASENRQGYSGDLKLASIEQKIDELRIFRFTDAIRFKDLKVIFAVFAVVVIVFTAGLIRYPDFFTESSVRLIHFQQKFEKPAPFSFFLENTDMELVTGESIELKLRCSGKQIPDLMYVNVSGNNFLMKKEGDLFAYTLENVNSSVSLYFTDEKYISERYKISVLNKPFISSFRVEIQSPGYTNLGNETLQNIGDLKVAAGTVVNWTFNTVDTDSLFLVFGDSTRIAGKKSGTSFELSKTIRSDTEYRVEVKNKKLTEENTLVYSIKTVADLFPEISVAQIRDSIDFKGFHFKGNIIDDYGFSQLDFNITANGQDSVIKIPVTPFLFNQDFYYSFNFESVKNRGKSMNYFFSVSDNDYLNNYKRSVSETFTFTFPDYQELLSKENSDLNSIEQLFEKSNKMTEEIKNEFENFKMKQINSEVSEWEKFQTVKDIMNKKTELEKVLEQISEKTKEANNFQNSFSEEKQEMIEKQKQIEELLNEVFSDELKKLFEEFNELAKQFDLKKFDELSKEMDSKMDDLARQLEKNMQLLKKMKVEQKVERVLQELKKLTAEEKEILKTSEKRSDLKRISEVENENLGVLKGIEKGYNEAVDYNKTIEKPLNLFNFDSEFGSIKETYSDIIDQSAKNNKRKTETGIDTNVKSMDQLIFAMGQMLTKNKKKKNEANIEDIKQILDNLILVSFGQEKILNTIKVIDYNNPLINELKVKQLNMKGQVEFIKDSLYTLSKRAPEIGSIINKEMLMLESSVKSSFENLESGNIGGARMFQQYGITAANNLALFLSEALENIKKQQNQSGESDEDCEKPGGKSSKPGMKKLKDSQDSMKEQLQQMIDQMKKGEMGKLSKSIGQTLAQQEIMQQMIRDMLNGPAVGSKAKEQLKAIDQLLEQTGRDLISKNITTELINRQNLILSKLLDAEKSEIERDFEEERESKTANDVKKENSEGYFEFKNKQKNERELIKRSNHQLNTFYDQKYNQFLKEIQH